MSNKIISLLNYNPMPQQGASATTAKFLSAKIAELFRFSSTHAASQGMSEAQKHWLYTERYVNGIAPRPNNPHATYTEVDEQFRPGSNTPSFSLPLFKLPRDRCNVKVAQNANPTIVAKYVNGSHLQFAVFPQVLNANTEAHIDDIKKCAKNWITVAPTASSRSLFVIGEDTALFPHCVKTHLPLRITRNMRGLNRDKIEHSINISDRIAQSITSFNNPQFAYLPETLGISLKGKNSDDSWGFLVREMTPHPFVPRSLPPLTLPLFALYSNDKMNPNKMPILCDLIEASGRDPKQFVLEKILYPIIRIWADVYQKTGIILESHGQNTLFELDEHGMPGRIINRDLSAYVSKEMYEKKGGSLAALNSSKIFSKNDNDETPPTECILSSVYDHVMRVPFDRIADLCEKKYGIPVAELQMSCQNYFKEVFPTADEHFPADNVTYNVKDADFTKAKKSGGKTEFVRTASTPMWR